MELLKNKESYMFRAMLDSLFCGLITINLRGEVLFCNDSARKIFNLCDDDLCMKSIDHTKLIKTLEKQVDIHWGSGRYIVDVYNKTIICNVSPLEDNGNRIGTIFVLHESMNANCLEQELDVTESLLQEVNIFIESAHDGFLVTDKLGNVVKLNTAFERMFDVERKKVLGRNLQELIEKRVFCDSAALRAIKTKELSTVVTNTNGKKLIATATPVFCNKGNLISVVVNIRDLTELDILQDQLERQEAIALGYFKELQTLSNQNFEKDGIVGNSKAMIKINDTINTISTVDSTVLITGESGVGKEVVVNQIYKTSNRRDKAFLKVNCAAIPDTLFESEMFGYEAGAFTGARSKGKAGYFELADEGTLFLDEIGELSHAGQVKLLRAIQEQEIIRVGGTSPVKVDVRIITSTNKDLYHLVNIGKFREDLYYRLNVISIEIPPLRKRREDIVPLALFFLEKYNIKHNKKKELSMDLAKFLRQLYWPGNIRELENLIENLVVLVENDWLRPEDVPERYQDEKNFKQVKISGIFPLKEAVEETERQLLEHAVEKYETTVEIAKALGVNQSTVSRKLHKYKIG